MIRRRLPNTGRFAARDRSKTEQVLDIVPTMAVSVGVLVILFDRPVQYKGMPAITVDGQLPDFVAESSPIRLKLHYPDDVPVDGSVVVPNLMAGIRDQRGAYLQPGVYNLGE